MDYIIVQGRLLFVVCVKDITSDTYLEVKGFTTKEKALQYIEECKK